MKPFRQPRTSAIARCTAVLALASFSLTTVAQAPPAESPQSSGSTAAPAAPSKGPKGISETLSKKQIEDAEDAYLAGARLLDKKDVGGAELEFAKALKLNPANHDYAMAAAVAHEQHVTQLVQQAGKARLLGQREKAETLLAEARLLDPQNEFVMQHLDPGTTPKVFKPEIEPWIREGPSLAGPVTLLPTPGPQSFHLHSDMQDVIRNVLSTYGIRAVFDESVKRDSVRFDLEDSP